MLVNFRLAMACVQACAVIRIKIRTGVACSALLPTAQYYS